MKKNGLYKNNGKGLRVGVVDTIINVNAKYLESRPDVLSNYVQLVEGKEEEFGHGDMMLKNILHHAPKAEIHYVGASSRHTLYAGTILSALKHLATLELDMISLSLGSYNDYANIRELVSSIAASGTLIFAASSNQPFNGDYQSVKSIYPASYEGVISVQPILCDSDGNVHPVFQRTFNCNVFYPFSKEKFKNNQLGLSAEYVLSTEYEEDDKWSSSFATSLIVGEIAAFISSLSRNGEGRDEAKGIISVLLQQNKPNFEPLIFRKRHFEKNVKLFREGTL